MRKRLFALFIWAIVWAALSIIVLTATVIGFLIAVFDVLFYTPSYMLTHEGKQPEEMLISRFYTFSEVCADWISDMVTGTGKKQEPEADKYKTVICKEEHAIIPDEAVDYPTDFIPSCLNDLPEPYRSEAIAAFKAEGNPSKYKAKYISGAFIWHASIQGLDYWVLVKQAINQNENLFNPDGSPRFTPEMFGGKSALKQADHA